MHVVLRVAYERTRQFSSQIKRSLVRLLFHCFINSKSLSLLLSLFFWLVLYFIRSFWSRTFLEAAIINFATALNSTFNSSPLGWRALNKHTSNENCSRFTRSEWRLIYQDTENIYCITMEKVVTPQITFSVRKFHRNLWSLKTRMLSNTLDRPPRIFEWPISRRQW